MWRRLGLMKSRGGSDEFSRYIRKMTDAGVPLSKIWIDELPKSVIAELRPGDTLIVASLEDLCDSPADLLVREREILERGASLRFLDQPRLGDAAGDRAQWLAFMDTLHTCDHATACSLPTSVSVLDNGLRQKEE